ncbi:efflux RND transporter periplasmic adaptor subunit [Bdellovibrionota bacterium FG-1]
MTQQIHHQSVAKVRWWVHPRAKKVLGVGAVIGVFGVLTWFFFFRSFVSTDDARVAATLVRLAPEGVSGKVVKLSVTEGDRIKAGQVLLELDHSVAEANLMKAKAKASQAERELKRAEQLAEQNGIPPREVDNTRVAGQMALADLQLAQIAYDRTFLKSPVDGIIVQKVTEIGNILEPNQSALTVADIDHAWISANIEETAVALVTVGQPVIIHVDEGGVLSGKVSEIRAATASQFALIQSENPSGNFTKLVQRIPIKVALDPHEGQLLRAGQSVEVKIRVR